MDIQSTPTTAIGTRGSAVKPGDIESITIDRADNGYTVRIRVKQKPPKKGEMREWDAGTEQEVYNRTEDMLARVKAAFDGVKLEKA